MLDRAIPRSANGLVKTGHKPKLLTPDGGSPAAILNREGAGPVCLVCEHASAFIPDWLEDLGLSEEHRLSHAVWDIGASSLTAALSERLDAPTVISRVSRLVYDCNRPPEATDAITSRSEEIEIPGNLHLSDVDRKRRIEGVYLPFHACVSEALDRFARPPALVTVHSFAPIWFGKHREVELGLLHDEDDRFAKEMFAASNGDVRTALNQPYSAKDGVTHTLARHASSRGLESVMIEVRSDLLEDESLIMAMADRLSRMLRAALSEGERA